MSPKRERTIAGEAAGDSGRPPEKLVEAQVQTDLRESCYQAIRAVTCQLDRGVLTLRGQVPSYYHKQLAQVVAHRRVAGAAVIRNDLEVVEPTAGARHATEPDWRPEES